MAFQVEIGYLCYAFGFLPYFSVFRFDEKGNTTRLLSVDTNARYYGNVTECVRKKLPTIVLRERAIDGKYSALARFICG